MNDLTPAIGQDFFDRTRAGWHVLFGAMDALAAAFLLIDGHGIWMLVPAGLALSYAALVVPPCSERARQLRAVAYLVLAYAAVGLLTRVDPNTLVLLFTVYPETYATLPTRLAVGATVLLTAIYTLVLIADEGWSPEALAARGFGGVVSLGFAVVLGLFITGIITQSSHRRDLIEELTAARKQLDDAQRQAGAASERERLARDIHDTLAQGYTSIVMLAQATEAALTTGKIDDARRRVEQIDDTARENLAEARSLIAAMQPAALEGRTLREALLRVVQRFQADSGVEATFTMEGEMLQHSANIDVVLIRAAQEALANVKQHAGAQHVAVQLCCGDGRIVLEVRDDGHGFDTAATSAGYGLAGMRARAVEVDGSIAVESSSTGTSIRLNVP